MCRSRAACHHSAILLLVIVSAPLRAQETADTTASERGQALRLYIECTYCDFEFIRSELSFVNHVRDLHDAQVQILITRQQTASRGYEHTITVIGRERFLGNNDTLSCVTRESDTDDIVGRVSCG